MRSLSIVGGCWLLASVLWSCGEDRPGSEYSNVGASAPGSELPPGEGSVPDVNLGGAAGDGASTDTGTGTASPGDGTDQIPVTDDSGQDSVTPGTDPPTTPSTSGSTGPGDWVAGDYPPDPLMETYLEITGVTGQPGPRQYKVHVPPGYDPAVPAPVVFCLHGLSQTPVMFCVNGAGMLQKSDDAGFVLVMPLGSGNSWNGGGCCGSAAGGGLDDVALMRATFEEVGSHLNLDLGRVYVTGLSNGGYMSYRLACEASDLFVAAAPGAGGISGFECNPTHPVSILDIHGTNDGLVPYGLQAPSLEAMAASNGCSSSTMPASQPSSGGDTTCVTHADCPAGVEVTGCTVEGGGHVWFGDPGCGTGAGAIGCSFVGANSNHIVNTDAIWDFFSRISR